MALYRFQVKHLSRLTQRSPVAKHVAYIMREADYGPAAAHVRYMTRESPTLQSREDLVHTEAHNLPPWAAGSPAAFFAAAERYERANGRFSTTWEIALPRELPRAAQITAVQGFLRTQFSDKQPYAWAMHESAAADGRPNPHVHVIFSERTHDGIDREAAQFFRRYNPDHPERGGAKKDRALNHQGAVALHRQAWADVANWHLEHAGTVARIDPRSLQDRGIARAPEKYMGPKHSVAAKYQGWETATWRETMRERPARAPHAAEEQASACAHWEERKRALGVTPATTHEAFLAAVAVHTRHAEPERDRPTLEALRTEHGTIAHALHRHETYAMRVRGELMLATQQAHSRRPDRQASQRVEALLGSVDAFPDEAPVHGARLRLRDRERGYDAGF